MKPLDKEKIRKGPQDHIGEVLIALKTILPEMIEAHLILKAATLLDHLEIRKII